MSLEHPPLAAGPRWYRARIRTLGPFLGLAPMLVFGLVATVSLWVGDGTLSGMIGLVCGTVAAPGLLIAGAPLAEESRYPVAVLASVPFWILLGFLASRRATRSPIASFRDYWRELTYLSLAVAVGAIAALLLATAIVGESLI